MSPFVEVMYGTVVGANSDSQLELPGTYGLGLVRYGLMFCSSPAGMRPGGDRSVLLPDDVRRAAAGGLALQLGVGLGDARRSCSAATGR